MSSVTLHNMALRCLIVDDSPWFLQAARVLLERQGMNVVGLASTSAEALERVGALRPDVTLVDINLGGESGFDLARRLHGEAGLTQSNVILISSHAEEDFMELITASPARGFLSKIDLSARAIRNLLRMGAPNRPSISRDAPGLEEDDERPPSRDP
jgi:two-component system, NarL family, nitrate/nitrite response regulator NarL